MIGQATDDGRPDVLRAEMTQRHALRPAAPGDRRAVVRRRSAIVALALACHLAILAGVAWLERANPPEDAGGATEIPVEMVGEPAAQATGAAQGGQAAAQAEPQPQPPPDASAQAPQPAPAAAGPPQANETKAEAAARPTGVIVERPAETSLPQEARKRGAPDAPEPKAAAAQSGAASPFGGLQALPKAAEAERAPAFLAPQSFLDQARPRPAPDPANDNYRAKALGRVAAAMLEPERPRPKALAIVGFRIDDAGTLAAVWLARPSGHADLDAEALDMVRRAAPFPPPPPNADRNFAAAIAFGGD